MPDHPPGPIGQTERRLGPRRRAQHRHRPHRAAGKAEVRSAPEPQELGQFAIGHQGAYGELTDVVQPLGRTRRGEADPGFGAQVVRTPPQPLFLCGQSPSGQPGDVEQSLAPIVEQRAEGVEGGDGSRIGVRPGIGRDLQHPVDLEIQRPGPVGHQHVLVGEGFDLHAPELLFEQIDGGRGEQSEIAGRQGA